MGARVLFSAASSPASVTPRIIVVDDNPINREVARQMLEKLGCRIDVASDGLEALRMHEAQAYDIVLMDCEMPGLDGFDATRRIRAMEQGIRRTPVIALSAGTDVSDRERCEAAGMDDYIAKPVRPQRLKEVLARWLQSPASLAQEAAHAPAQAQQVQTQIQAQMHTHIHPQEQPADRLEAVQALFGADFADLARTYQADGRNRLALLRQALDARDSALLAKIAHVFSGSSASIGAARLCTLCRELDARARSGIPEDAWENLAAIEAEYGRICAKLQDLLGNR